MRGLGWNVALAAVWVAMTGEVALWNVALGVAVGLAIILFAGGLIGASGYVALVLRVMALGLYYLWELLRSNARLAYDIVVPRVLMRPAILAVPLDAKTDLEITVLANLITLTPGSTAITLSDDRKTLYVHVMYPEPGDLDTTRRAIKEGLEARILGVTRP